MGKQLSDLSEATELSSADLILLRNTSGIDQKITVLNALSRLVKGYNGVVLTEWDTGTQPQILAGSLVEINGGFYINPGTLTIYGTTVVSTWYNILLTPVGTTYAASFIARSVGAWSDAKFGLYDGNNRIVGCVYKDASGNFINKNIFHVVNRLVKVKMEIGDWNMDTETTKSITPHSIPVTKIRNIYGMIRDDSNVTYSPLKALFDTDTGEMELGIYRVTSTIIDLRRFTTGIFDNDSYDSTSFNRGWVIVEYEV